MFNELSIDEYDSTAQSTSQTVVRARFPQVNVDDPPSKPEFVIVESFSNAGGNRQWEYKDSSGKLCWPAAAEAEVEKCRKNAEGLIRHFYGLDPGTYILHVNILDGYSGTDYQPRWQSRAGVPKKYDAQSFVERLSTVEAVFTLGYRGMGCNVQGLAELLKGMRAGAHIFYIVEGGPGMPNYTQRALVLDLLRVLITRQGPETLFHILSQLVQATRMRLRLSMATLEQFSDGNSIWRNRAGLDPADYIELLPVKRKNFLYTCDVPQCDSFDILGDLTEAMRHYLEEHHDILAPTQCKLCLSQHEAFHTLVQHVRAQHHLSRQTCTTTGCLEGKLPMTAESLAKHKKAMHEVEEDSLLKLLVNLQDKVLKELNEKEPLEDME